MYLEIYFEAHSIVYFYVYLSSIFTYCHFESPPAGGDEKSSILIELLITQPDLSDPLCKADQVEMTKINN